MRLVRGGLVSLLLLATAAFADEPNPRQSDPREPRAFRHVILDATGPLTPADREELAARGLFVQRSITGTRYLARVAEGRTIADPRVEAIETIAADDKISPSARREARAGRVWAEVNVYFHEDVTVEEARSALLAASASLEDPFVLSFAPANRIRAKIAPVALGALAGDDRVLSVTGPMRFEPVADNARSAALSHVPEVHAAPYGLSGAGVVASLFELAPAQADHVEFGGRLTVMPSVQGGTSSDARHATHVSGTISAGGVNPDAKGMAPQVRLFQFCVRAGNNSCRNDYLKDKNEELTKLGVKVDNNSWGYQLGWETEDLPVWNAGDDYFGAYDLEITSPIDRMALERGILFVHSAGNEGTNPSFIEWGQHRHVDDNFRTIPGKVWCYSANGSGTDCPTTICTGDTNPCEKTKHNALAPFGTHGFTGAGKNSISVGALRVSGETVESASYSSRGPAQDGRVKPDVVARGSAVLSSIPTGAYGSLSGTSMASPAVAGIAVLLIEQWRRTFGADPDPVQLKAVIVAGADDLGPQGPDYTFGFGLVNAKSSVDLILQDEGRGNRIRNVTIPKGGREELPIVVSSPQNLRVVLQWGDPAIPLVPGKWIAPKALVNDLDLKVIGPAGTEHLPYVLDPTRVDAGATTGVNTVDNTEEVEIRNAPAGTYRVVVTGTTVPEGPQRAVIVSTVRTARPCVDITEAHANTALTPGSTVSAALCSPTDEDVFQWTAVPGQPVSVTFTTGDTPLRISVQPTGTTQTIAANTTQTVSLGTVTTATVFTLTVSPAGALGAEPVYSFTPVFKQQTGPRRRSTRH